MEKARTRVRFETIEPPAPDNQTKAILNKLYKKNIVEPPQREVVPSVLKHSLYT